MDKVYYIVDGRVWFDPDAAGIAETCLGLDEAKRKLREWPDDHAILDPRTGVVLGKENAHG